MKIIIWQGDNFFFGMEATVHDRQHVVCWVIPGGIDDQGFAKTIESIPKLDSRNH